MRVIAGEFRGRRLQVPKGRSVRPTGDRVRESLFSQLGDLTGLRVLDLFAGSGALGFEALSRGAASVVFVERASGAAKAVEENIEILAVEARCQLIRTSAMAALRRLCLAGDRFDLAFLDPPYASGEAEPALLAAAPLIPASGEVVLESGFSAPPPEVEGYRIADQRRYGDTQITRYNREPAA